MPGSLSERTIVVTGAASGIGMETAADLARRGASVIAVDKDRAAGDHEWVRADLSGRDGVDALIEQLPGEIDGLCNIAGVAPSLHGELVLRVNFLALRHLTLGLVPKLADGASVVHLASMAGNGWRDNLEQIGGLLEADWENIAAFTRDHGLESGPRSYFLAKESVIVWTMLNRWTWRDRGIRMNTVSPGPIETPILEDFLETLGERAQESVRNLDRFGRPSDVAPAVAFLLSDESEWFRSANLTPDGGMGAHLALKRHGLV